MTDADWETVLNGGLYTVPMAARLLGAKPEKVRAWVAGYPHSDAQPIIIRQVPRIGGKIVLGFLNLVESAFIRHFRTLGFSAQTIRKLAMKLRDRHGLDHPFAMNRRFRDDGRSIFDEVIEENGERQLLNLMNDNFELAGVVGPSLFDRVLYVADLADAWQPLEGHPQVIVTPKSCFGMPVVQSCGVPTAVLYRSYLAEGSEEDTAAEFDVTVEDVLAAVNFERGMEKRTIH